jgi:hypothetical protein
MPLAINKLTVRGDTGAKGDTGDPGPTTWAGITDKPSTFTPSAHEHAQSEVTDLVTALSGKEPANSNIQTHVTSAHAPSDAQKNSNITKAEIEAKLTGEISSHTHAGGDVSLCWPIGSVFTSVVATNPNTLLGFGTWSAIASGKVLVGLDSGDANFDTVEETGGAKTSTPSAHSGATVADHPAGTTGTFAATSKLGTSTANTATIGHSHTTPALTHTVGQANDHAAMSIVQPYFVVYFWKRTA